MDSQGGNRYAQAWHDADIGDRGMAVVFTGYWLSFLYQAVFSPPWHSEMVLAEAVVVFTCGLAWSVRRWRRRRQLDGRFDEMTEAIEDAGGWQRLEPEHRDRIEALLRSADPAGNGYGLVLRH